MASCKTQKGDSVDKGLRSKEAAPNQLSLNIHPTTPPPPPVTVNCVEPDYTPRQQTVRFHLGNARHEIEEFRKIACGL